MGHWEWGMGHGEWNFTHACSALPRDPRSNAPKERKKSVIDKQASVLFLTPHALCPMPYYLVIASTGAGMDT